MLDAGRARRPGGARRRRRRARHGCAASRRRDARFLAARTPRAAPARRRARCGSSAPTAPPGARAGVPRRARRDVIVAAPGGRVVDGDRPASALVVELRRAAPRPRGRGRAAGAAGRAAARLPRRPRHARWPTRCARASTSRSSTSRAASARTSSPSTPTSSSAGLERGLDPQVTRTLMGNAYPTPGPALEVLRRRHGPARARSSRTPSGATTRSRSPARASTTRTWATPATSTAPRTSTRQLDAVRDRGAQGLGGAELLLQHRLRPGPRAALRRAVVAPRRLRAAAGADRPRLRVVGLPGRHRPRQRLGDHRRPRPRLLAGEPLLDGRSPTASPRRPSP